MRLWVDLGLPPSMLFTSVFFVVRSFTLVIGEVLGAHFLLFFCDTILLFQLVLNSILLLSIYFTKFFILRLNISLIDLYKAY